VATLIDSSVLIDAERRVIDLNALFSVDPLESFAISSVTASELLHGIYRANSAKLRQRRQGFVEGILTALPVISFDLRVARVHAAMWADLARRGAAVGERDLMIAATAIAHDLRIVTRDLRSFPKIPGIEAAVL
jgi:tRNA(fMet)-specific endonuclease VapC